jgi:two-component system, chemotaxis family, chemotaxis protein CheY
MKADVSRLKFLVADDNRFMREITRAILFAFGARVVHEAADGAEALQLFRDHVPDIVFLDIAMPILDGIETLRLLRDRSSSPNPYVPVIMLSAYSERWRVLQARDAGATEYLVKPVSAAAILARVTSVVLDPRPFVETKGYFGPDRRRFIAPTLGHAPRRAEDASENVVRLVDVPEPD